MTWPRRLTIALVLTFFALPAMLAPRNFPTDDSLFYLQVARHIAAGHGSTFDTISITNGFHPLWMGPCVAAAWISGGEPTAMLRTVMAMQVLLAIGCLILFRHLALRLGIRSWPLGLPVLAAFFLTGLYGSEAHINGFCILASLIMLVEFTERPTPRSAVSLGVLLGLTFLARLDNIFLVVAMAVGAASWTLSRSSSKVATLSRVLVPLVVVVSPYLLWNLLSFGHLVPISGAIKSTFPRIYGDLRNLGVLGLSTFVVGVLGGAGLLLWRGDPLRRLVLGAMALGVLGQALYITFFTDHNTHWSWYYVAGVLLATFLVCAVADEVAAKNRILSRRAVGIAAIALLLTWGLARAWARFANSRASSHNQFVFRVLTPSRDERWEVQFAQYMNRSLPAHAGVLVYDYPGALAFYSSLRIVPADGLIGGYGYDADLRRKGLSDYLAAHSIEYFVGELPASPDSCLTETIFAPIERLDVGSLILCSQDLVATCDQVVRGVPAPPVGLYRIRIVAPARGMPRDPMLKHGLLW